MQSISTLMSRTNTESVGESYGGADMMANNGLSANQNQVIFSKRSATVGRHGGAVASTRASQ